MFCILAYLASLQDQADIRWVMVLFGLKIFTKHGLLLALLGSNTDCNLNMLCLVGFVCEVLGCFWSEHWEK